MKSASMFSAMIRRMRSSFKIKEYVDDKGKDFRLLFMVDEVGQYIGDDGDLMINLQSIVEEIGTQCRGKVWVMVTSQEAIDSVVKISGDDFSKIQGRFNTRLSLSSSSVDEVIKKRVLAKSDEATSLLRMVYDKEHAVLKNLYTFNNPVLDIKGFSDGDEFVSTFPFVPYQFIIIQKVLAEIRKHGNSGKHLSGGERSMLSGFQEAAQKVQDTIVVFSRPEGVSVKYPIETRVNLSATACRISESTWNVASWEHLVERP